ncbi:DUF1659 domain-containing protein [Metallumcola ferriviriculae]|uniref:DUF1659 domain-containing protein n=1 Tax=Metallumcola ferriviriculae TaxID=3039180 RepID=A0AAU0URC4_9FIRM|nr:DUF1659 domain-containing protein [Desulfitibacteraceae bacterium MK1]
MAVTSTIAESSLLLMLQTGTDAAGNPQFDNRTFRRVRPVALDQDVYDVAVIIAGLQNDTLAAVQRVNENDLVMTI